MLTNLQHQYDVFIRRLGKVTFHLKMRLTGNQRPTSYPYVAGDSFRALADHIYDEVIKSSPTAVRRGDIVFVSQELLHEYFATFHPKVTEKYVLICHNGDVPVDDAVVSKIDDTIGHFFAQDVVVGHERITPIPIGIENLRFYIAGVVPFFNRLRKKLATFPPVRKNRIFFNFSLNTNPEERGPAREYFLSHPLMETAERFMTPRRHSKLLATYKFVASPPGHAIESCRTWEAMYFGTIPIVKDFVAMRSFASYGLPLWIVKDWRELEGITEADLANTYTTMMAKANLEALHMDFWIKKVKEKQAEIREAA